MARKMRAGVVVTTLFLVVACGSPGPTGTPSAASPAIVTPAITSQPTAPPMASWQPNATATPPPTVGPSTVPPPPPSPTIKVPPPIDGPETGTPAPPFPSPTIEVPPPIDGPETGTPAPPFQSACLAVVDQAIGDFPSRLVLDLAFEEGVNQRDITKLEVGFAGANDAIPVDATHQFATTWQAVLGYRPSDPDPLRINLATVETPDGVVHNILPAVSEAIGTIPRNFGPGDSVGDLCGGFGDPF